MVFIERMKKQVTDIDRLLHKKMISQEEATEKLDALKKKIKEHLKLVEDTNDDDYEDELKELLSDIKELKYGMDPDNADTLPGGRIYEEVERRDKKRLQDLCHFLDRAVTYDGSEYTVHEVEFPEIDRQLQVLDWSTLRRKQKFFPGGEKKGDHFEIDFQERKEEATVSKYVPPAKRVKKVEDQAIGNFKRDELLPKQASKTQERHVDQFLSGLDDKSDRISKTKVDNLSKFMQAKQLLRIISSKKVAIDDETYRPIQSRINQLIDESAFTVERMPKKKVGFIPSGGGKSYLAQKYSNLFVDIDSLPTQYERFILDKLLVHDMRSGDFNRSNKYWNVIIENHMHQIGDRVLLAHHPKQINKVIKFDGVCVLTERANSDDDPIRNKKLSDTNAIALINSDIEVRFTMSKNLPIFFIWYFRSDVFEQMY